MSKLDFNLFILSSGKWFDNILNINDGLSFSLKSLISPVMAAMWASNWLILAPSIVQCPELCTLGAISFAINSSNSFIKGEAFVFEFVAVGSSVKFPKIEKIDGYLVEDLGTSRSLQIINGNYDEKLSKKYRIVPKSDFTIPSFTFIINDNEIQSEPKKITSTKVSKTASSRFDLTLRPSKTSLYVGEDLLVKLIFKYKRGVQITDLGFEQPHFENFWYKKVDSSSKRFEQNGYIVQELDFLLL